MYAFAPSTFLGVSSSARSPFVSDGQLCQRPSTVSGPTMILRNSVTKRPVGIDSTFGGVGVILNKADTYMADTIRRQYKKMGNPMGVYGVQCTEGGVKFSAEVARVRALNANYRQMLRSPSKKYFDMYENRKAAISASGDCHHEERQFCAYPQSTAAYNLGKSEAMGACIRYATPETLEETAMLRYMDIQQNNAANPSGVYNMSCNEGAAKGQAEDIRIAALNAAYRNAQKPMGVLLQEKFNQRKQGYAFANGCNYEEGLISKYPAIGAAFRSKSYGY